MNKNISIAQITVKLKNNIMFLLFLYNPEKTNLIFFIHTKRILLLFVSIHL